MKFRIEKATDGKHKWVGIFDEKKHVPFGAIGYRDYTQHHDPLRRAAYLSRHRSRENWNDPQTAGSLSRWILWGNSTSIDRNVSAFKRKFLLA